MALGVVRAIRDLGLAIPGDVSLIAHDDVFPWLKPENFSVPLSTTRSSIRAAGARIAERLAARISGLETACAARFGRSIWWCAARLPARLFDCRRIDWPAVAAR